MTTAYNVSYKYLNPGPAGPFVGRLSATTKTRRGTVISATFGEARVISCCRINTNGAVKVQVLPLLPVTLNSVRKMGLEELRNRPAMIRDLCVEGNTLDNVQLFEASKVIWQQVISCPLTTR